MSAPIIETHVHLTMKQYRDDLDDVLNRARMAGVARFITIGLKEPEFGETWDRAIRLASMHDDILFALAVHPHDAKHATDDDFERLAEIRNTNPKLVGVGEIGLDYHYNYSPPEIQRDVFARFINAAKELSLPIIVHSREAFEHTFQVMQQEHAEQAGGVIHCFGYGVEEAKKFVDMGFFIGVGGVITFKRADELRMAVRAVGLDRIVLETDGPYLAPVPHRGKRNEPAMLGIIARKVAEVLECDLDDVLAKTTENACKLFGIEL